MEMITVGIDGSAGSLRALAWATREAQLRGARLHLVCAWLLPPEIRFAGSADRDPEVAAKQCLSDAIAFASDLHTPGATLEITTWAANMATQPALMNAAASADLLVVGATGHSQVVGMLLGSTSLYCAIKAPCPVVIVPAPDGHR